MPRIRTFKPELLRHEKLQDLEAEHAELRPMLVFAGLWTQADKEGRFEYSPRTLKLDILPFVPFDMAETLALLEREGFVVRYRADGKEYGLIPSFKKHQRIGGKEAQDPPRFPPPPDGLVHGETTGNFPSASPGSNGEASGIAGKGKGKGREREKEKEKERKGERSAAGAAVLSSSDSSNPISIDKDLEAFARAWNALPRDQRGGDDVKLDPPTTTTLEAWRHRIESAEFSRLIADPTALADAVAQSPFLHGKFWFKFEWLFKANNGRLNLEKVLDGQYRRQNAGGTQPAPRSSRPVSGVDAPPGKYDKLPHFGEGDDA
jgi:hypothetical protein